MVHDNLFIHTCVDNNIEDTSHWSHERVIDSFLNVHNVHG